MTNQTGSKKYIIEFIMFFSYAFFAVNWIAGSALTTQIMESFHITSFASATFITNAITIAKIVGNLFAAWILVKLLPKKAILLGSFLIVLGSVLSTVSQTYLMFVAARFIMGFGGALFVVYFGPVVINYFKPHRRAFVNGLNASAYNIGSIIALIIVTPIITWLQTWQLSMLFFAGCSAVFLILWWIFGEDFDLNKSSADKDVKKYTFGEALKERFNYVFPITYGGLLTLYIVALTIFPLSDDAAIDPKLLSALMAFAGVVGAAFGILYVKKFTKRLPIMRISGLLMTISAFIMFTTSNGTIAIISAIAMGFLMFLPVTALVTIPQELPKMSPAKLTVIMGIFWAFSYAFQTIVYFIIGFIIDGSGYEVGLLVAAFVSLTFFIGSFLLPETGKKVETEGELKNE